MPIAKLLGTRNLWGEVSLWGNRLPWVPSRLYRTAFLYPAPLGPRGTSLYRSVPTEDASFCTMKSKIQTKCLLKWYGKILNSFTFCFRLPRVWRMKRRWPNVPCANKQPLCTLWWREDCVNQKNANLTTASSVFIHSIKVDLVNH